VTSLADITARLEAISTEMDAENTSDERLRELIAEASDLAAEAGRQVDEAMRAAADAQRAT